jgi:hypothetical protein
MDTFVVVIIIVAIAAFVYFFFHEQIDQLLTKLGVSFQNPVAGIAGGASPRIANPNVGVAGTMPAQPVVKGIGYRAAPGLLSPDAALTIEDVVSRREIQANLPATSLTQYATKLAQKVKSIPRAVFPV